MTDRSTLHSSQIRRFTNARDGFRVPVWGLDDYIRGWLTAGRVFEPAILREKKFTKETINGK